jgi:hypothetical protein
VRNNGRKPLNYLVIHFREDRKYPIIERLTTEEILELKRRHPFKDMAIIEGDVLKGFGADSWGGIK